MSLKLFLMQSLTKEEWERASVFEVASTTALARIDENLDLSATNGNFFSTSIEKLKDASVVRVHPPFIDISFESSMSLSYSRSLQDWPKLVCL